MGKESQRRAETKLGWNRDLIRKGTHWSQVKKMYIQLAFWIDRYSLYSLSFKKLHTP